MLKVSQKGQTSLGVVLDSVAGGGSMRVKSVKPLEMDLRETGVRFILATGWKKHRECLVSQLVSCLSGDI